MRLDFPSMICIVLLHNYFIRDVATNNLSRNLFMATSVAQVPTTSSYFMTSSISVSAINETTSSRTHTLIQSSTSVASKFTKCLSDSESSTVNAIGSTMSSTKVSSTPSSFTTKNQGPYVPRLSEFGIVMISFAVFLIVFLIVALIWMRRNRERRADGPRMNVKIKPPRIRVRSLKPLEPEESPSDFDQSEASELPSSSKVDHPLSRSNPSLSTSSLEQKTSFNNNITQTSEGTWRESKLI